MYASPLYCFYAVLREFRHLLITIMFFVLLKIIRFMGYLLSQLPRCSPELSMSSSDELEREIALSLFYRWRNPKCRETVLPKVKVLF